MFNNPLVVFSKVLKWTKIKTKSKQLSQAHNDLYPKGLNNINNGYALNFFSIILRHS